MNTPERSSERHSGCQGRGTQVPPVQVHRGRRLAARREPAVHAGPPGQRQQLAVRAAAGRLPALPRVRAAQPPARRLAPPAGLAHLKHRKGSSHRRSSVQELFQDRQRSHQRPQPRWAARTERQTIPHLHSVDRICQAVNATSHLCWKTAARRSTLIKRY